MRGALAVVVCVVLAGCAPGDSDETPPAPIGGRVVIDDVHARLDEARRSERLLVFSGPERDPDLERMRERIDARRAEVDERDLTVAWLEGPATGTFGEARLSVAAVDALRLQTGLDAETFGGVLIGKDGGTKDRYAAPIELDVVFALIDAMPMRRREIREGD